jgi:hypothetical protein
MFCGLQVLNDSIYGHDRHFNLFFSFAEIDKISYFEVVVSSDGRGLIRDGLISSS